MTLAVNYAETGVKDGSSPGGGYGWRGGAAAPRQIRVKWGDRIAAMQQLVGYSYPHTSAGGRFLRRELPELVPWDSTLHCTNARLVRGEKWTGRTAYDKTTRAVLDGYPNTNATKTDDTGQGDSAGLPNDALWKANEFKWAVIGAEYAAADFYIRSDADIDAGTYGTAGSELARFVSYREDRQVKGIVVQGSTLYWVLNNGSDPESIPFGIPRIEFEKTVYLKWWQVAVDAVPWTTIDNMIAKVNKTAVLSIYPADSMLMMPPRVDRYVMANGLIGCDIEMCYGYTPNLQTKLLHVRRDAGGRTILSYKWVTGNMANRNDPTPGTLIDGDWLFNEAEFADCFVPNNP